MSNPVTTAERCEQSPYCTDEKCRCEEYRTRTDDQKIVDFHKNQMNVLNNLIRTSHEGNYKNT